MMWGQLHNLTESVKKRNAQKTCSRCCLLFKKSLTQCPRCTDVSDEDLDVLLQQRADTRVGMGKTMFYVAAVFGLLFIIINFIV